MFNKLIIFIFLLIFWFGFSGERGAFFIISGILSCLIAMYFVDKLKTAEKIKLTPKIFIYWLWLGGEIIKSSLFVVKRIWQSEPDISPNFVEVEVKGRKNIFYAIYGNSITLTPGTVTVFIDEKSGKIIAHGLSTKGEEDVLGQEMIKHIEKALI